MVDFDKSRRWDESSSAEAFASDELSVHLEYTLASQVAAGFFSISLLAEIPPDARTDEWSIRITWLDYLTSQLLKEVLVCQGVEAVCTERYAVHVWVSQHFRSTERMAVVSTSVIEVLRSHLHDPDIPGKPLSFSADDLAHDLTVSAHEALVHDPPPSEWCGRVAQRLLPEIAANENEVESNNPVLIYPLPRKLSPFEVGELTGELDEIDDVLTVEITDSYAYITFAHDSETAASDIAVVFGDWKY